MARLFPKIDPSEIDKPGERKVAEALVSQLASRVEVFHSFHWLGASRKGTLVEASATSWCSTLRVVCSLSR